VTRLHTIGVVIPARDEEELIAGCLDSVLDSARVAALEWGSDAPLVDIVVVADGCLDHTVEIARGYEARAHQPGISVRVIEIESSNVGTTRATGAQAVLDQTVSRRDRVWIANTDADSQVPTNWILAQIDGALREYDVIVGTVRPDFADLTSAQRAAWEAGHVRGRPNGHVHGANLGVRANLYAAVGGFAHQSEHEDVSLVDRLRFVGARVLASDDAEVITSGRQVGRTPGGYAGYLRTQLVAPVRQG